MAIPEQAQRRGTSGRQDHAVAWMRRHAVSIALLSILFIGAGLRLTGLNWDGGHYLHPDERFLAMVATGIHWPGSVGQYFNSAESSLNPYNNDFPTFIYGTFPLFLDKAVADLAGRNTYDNFYLVSRAVSATFDLVTTLLLFVVGRRLFGPAVGLAAALLHSLTVLHIQLSHFGTFDTFVATFCLAAFYFALRANETNRWWEYALAGTMVGLAIASKLSALPILAVVTLPLIEGIRRSGWRTGWREPPAGELSPLLGVVIAVGCAIWSFRITQPYAFAGPSPLAFTFDPRWTADVRYWQDVQSGVADMPPSHQWANRTPILFVVDNLVRWGMGVPLGVTALVALALAGWRVVTARRWPATWLLVLVGWPAFHLLYYGTAFLKTGRYLLPTYPYLTLLAAALLVTLWSRGGAAGRAQRYLGYAPLVVVVLATAWYAVAFAGIYTRPPTRIAASVWIYENVPPGSTRATESWDDAIPYQLPGYPSPSDYPEEQLDLYAEDNPEKLAMMLAQLNRADYICLTSNRVYGSIPRLPERYPMTSEYYRMLFSGELGFDLIKTFTSRPRFLGLELNDDNAEEAFTVYDHPKVLIFEKTAAYSAREVKEKLGAKLTGDIATIRPVQAGRNLLMLTDAEQRVQQAGGTWSEIFDPDGVGSRHPVGVWYLALQAMALAAFPLCWRILRGLPDRGYAVAKTLGLLIVGYVAWLLPSLQLMEFGRGAVIAGVVVAAALSLLALGRRREAFVTDVRGRWLEFLFAEALFIAAFCVFVWFRSQNPDLWHPWRGGEKPMEFAYFNAVVRSTHFPPYDPWFAGGYLNYYYFGYALVAAVVRLTGVIPSIAFNLAVPTLFALLVLNTWSFTTSTLRVLAREQRMRLRMSPLLLGLTGPLFVAVIGNLDLARRIGRGEYGYPPNGDGDLFALGTFGDVTRGIWRVLTDARPLPDNGYWDATRVIDGTINEFPYFSFLFADLHPHMIALPFTTAALLVALGVLLARRWPGPGEADVPPPELDGPLFGVAQGWSTLVRSVPWRLSLGRATLVGLAALVTGALYPLNTWDFPTYVVVLAGAFLLLEAVVGVVVPEVPAPATEASQLEGGSAGTASGFRPQDYSAAPSPPHHRVAWHLTYATLRRAVIWVMGTIALGRLLFWPFFAHYEIPSRGFEPWQGSATRPEQYLIIHGTLLFFFVSFLLAELVATLPTRTVFHVLRPIGFGWSYGPKRDGDRQLDASLALAVRPLAARPVELLGAGAGGLLLLALWSDRIEWLLVALLALTVLVAWQRRHAPVRLFLLGMGALALGLSAAVERYALRGDVGRMNTVFKFYLQVWVLLALAAAISLVMLIVLYRSVVDHRGRAAWTGFAVVLLVAGLIYPAVATSARLHDRLSSLPPTLDGMAYMSHAVYEDHPDGRQSTTYELVRDFEAIRWLEDNVEGSPVILEGIAPPYRWGSRVSVYTGLPTVLGWDWHQQQQRAGYGALIERRKEDVRTMLGEISAFDDIRPLLDKYNVRYIYVGELERAYYDERALRKFDRAVAEGQLTLVYDHRVVRIYRYDVGERN
jgi:YYY domain-containing protein